MVIAFDQSISTRVFLIRHGQTEWNKKRLIQGPPDIPLNEEGIRQAHSLTTWVKGRFKIDTIRTSPEERALQTANIINAAYQVDVLVDLDLAEVNFGALINKNMDDFEKGESEYIQQFNQFLASYGRNEIDRPELPNGESIAEIEGRIRICIDRIKPAQQGKSPCCIT